MGGSQTDSQTNRKREMLETEGTERETNEVLQKPFIASRIESEEYEKGIQTEMTNFMQ